MYEDAERAYTALRLLIPSATKQAARRYLDLCNQAAGEETANNEREDARQAVEDNDPECTHSTATRQTTPARVSQRNSSQGPWKREVRSSRPPLATSDGRCRLVSFLISFMFVYLRLLPSTTVL